ncbi:exopolyphosphatase / guanosine-5'-triphosphate,3'-diphosphate pyrophosphatase [Sphingomonas gellani]|uniref:Exopolyphosphatase / guanosine-5'-triphosphate,3'-diphosphate pyrophosphatase n=2 Tax=Sphingomonas gellani TaxID=1166340 RepID=A0A1H7ZST4_9SPHN|nr:exopolyphosphatase / guanosine-5'-triphosphate,3'-diphosphate pyrophosphatase [Sphingomonas gellani]
MATTRESDASRTAIIDIGSNSIRLVVYQGPARIPAVLFNEKVLAGLGRGVATSGAIDEAGMAAARTALARFAAVAREMKVTTVRTVATAAVRDASNGADLIDAATANGLSVELLSGEEEATASGQGVLSAFPSADGIVGDLGGGSLELVRLSRGTITERVSFPLGVLRLAALPERRGKAFVRHVGWMIERAGWKGAGKGLPIFLVGGSWRALARLHMHLTAYPLPIIHGYAMTADEVTKLVCMVGRLDKTQIKEVPGLSSGRAATLGDAGALLEVLFRTLGPQVAIASSFGLREGLLHQALDADTRALDPLIVAAREEGRQLGRFAEHGDLLQRWIDPVFADEPPHIARIRHAACLLADVGWRANPEFRAERGLEIALHGAWVGITASERAVLAQALFTSLCGRTESPAPLDTLATDDALRQAASWGLAMRLGQRLSAGLARPLERSSLHIDGSDLVLSLPQDDEGLYGETVAKRHAALAAFIGRNPRRGVA